MFSASALSLALSGAVITATTTTAFTAGTTVNSPNMHGKKMRRNRCQIKARRPCRRHNIAVKNRVSAHSG